MCLLFPLTLYFCHFLSISTLIYYTVVRVYKIYSNIIFYVMSLFFAHMFIPIVCKFSSITTIVVLSWPFHTIIFFSKQHFCYRCKSFQSVKRGEICRIPGCSVSPSAPGTPTPVRLPQFQGETFKQFINYVYTGKVRLD